MKHTPGPWVIGEPIDGESFISGPDWVNFAMVYVECEGETDPTGKANARLISAAPELLEALKTIINHTDTRISTHLIAEVNRVRDIIDKIEGGS